jgi:hypothetical protein
LSEITEAIVSQSIAAYNRGLTDGQAIERQNILDMLEQEDSTCADWAIVLIKGQK